MKKIATILILILVLGCNKPKQKVSKLEIVMLKPKAINEMVLGTGIISPSRRIKIMASIEGRVERIFFKEGDFVNQGHTLAYISTIERISLIDIARANYYKARSTGDDELIKEAKEEYKTANQAYSPVPIMASASGKIINRDIEEKEYVTPDKTLFILAGRLILKINVDEADINKIKTRQNANFYFDAFPDKKYSGKVKTISEEGILFDNIMQYEVTVLPDEISKKWFSGMSVNAEFPLGIKSSILSLPVKAVKNIRKKNYVFVLEEDKKTLKEVETGIFDHKNIQIINGVNKKDKVLILSHSEFNVLFKKGLFPLGIQLLLLLIIIIGTLLILKKFNVLPKKVNEKFDNTLMILKKLYKKY